MQLSIGHHMLMVGPPGAGKTLLARARLLLHYFPQLTVLFIVGAVTEGDPELFSEYSFMIFMLQPGRFHHLSTALPQNNNTHYLQSLSQQRYGHQLTNNIHRL